MSRKFSDSEVRAYSKNRYEDKLLRGRLEKLKESAGIFHDASSKQRQDLVAECKDIRMTTGESRAPAGVVMTTDFDISNRVTRPWAYSVMETTYNAVYRDAVIPIPKKNRRKLRTKSGASRGLASRSSMYSSRVMSSKSYSPSIKSSMTARSDTTLQQKLAPPTINRSVSNPEISRNHPANISIKVDTTCVGEPNRNGNNKAKTFVFENQIPNRQNHSENSQDHVDGFHNTTKETLTVHSQHDIENSQSEILKIDEKSESGNGFVKEHKRDTRIITLPPVYKIDSKAYQDAERERLLTRSRSRVSFSDMAGTQEVHVRDQRTQKPKSPSETKRPSSETKHTDKVTDPKHAGKDNDENHTDYNSSERKPLNISTIDPDSLVDVNVRKQGDIVYRGRRLKNYIKPEERYKLDPMVMKRRQNKMDKLAKESTSFLKRVNHENIKVEIAFPRSARKRILTKLVNENNSTQGKIIKDNNEPIIQQKINYFMNSMSEYIHQQQLEREEYFSHE